MLANVGALPHDDAEIERLHAAAAKYLDELSRYPYDDSRHTPALQHIADTDTWPENGPAWNDELRLAIQHRLLTVFRAFAPPDEVQPELHRAAPLIPLLLQRHQQQMQQAQQQHLAQMSGALAQPPGAGPVPAEAAGANATAEGGGAVGSNSAVQNGAEGGETQFSATPMDANAAQAALASRFVSASALDAAASALSISQADLSSFYPSKRHLHQFLLVQQHQQQQQQQQQLHQQQQQFASQPAPSSSIVAAAGAPPSLDASASSGPTSIPAASAVEAPLPIPPVSGPAAGPGASASQNVSSLFNNGQPLSTGPPLYAPQIPLKHAEVMLHDLLKSAFSLERASSGADTGNKGEGKDKGVVKEEEDATGAVAGDAAETDRKEGKVKEEPADASRSEDAMETDAPSKADAAVAGPSSTSKLPTSTSSSSLFGFSENTSTLPICDPSTPLFLDSPPFTIQRLAELALAPERHHSSSTKFLHALERVLRVTATWKSVQEREAVVAAKAAAGETEVGDKTDAPPPLVPVLPGTAAAAAAAGASSGPGGPLGVPTGMVDEIEAADTLAAVAQAKAKAGGGGGGSSSGLLPAPTARPAMSLDAAAAAAAAATASGAGLGLGIAPVGNGNGPAPSANGTSGVLQTAAAGGGKRGAEASADGEAAGSEAGSEDTEAGQDEAGSESGASSSGQATATSTAERTLKRMRSERSLKGR
ncbi:hypothetical protein OC834_001347 [Tilletia horrida]|nr:hypothetical protein OC834_001347 [Tilletia horrida]